MTSLQQLIADCTRANRIHLDSLEVRCARPYYIATLHFFGQYEYIHCGVRHNYITRLLVGIAPEYYDMSFTRLSDTLLGYHLSKNSH